MIYQKLYKVDQYIDKNSKSLKESLEEVPSIKTILEQLDVIEEKYYSALKFSGYSDFQIHIRCKPNPCFVINYLVEGL